MSKLPEEYINLLFSILQRQLDDIRCLMLDKLTTQVERDGKRAVRWLFYDKGEHIMSASSICYLIGFDVQVLQDRVKTWSNNNDNIRNRIIYEQNGFSVNPNQHFNNAMPSPKLTVWTYAPDVEECNY